MIIQLTESELAINGRIPLCELTNFILELTGRHFLRVDTFYLSINMSNRSA